MNRSVRGWSEKSFERTNGLDTELYKNIPSPFLHACTVAHTIHRKLTTNCFILHMVFFLRSCTRNLAHRAVCTKNARAHAKYGKCLLRSQHWRLKKDALPVRQPSQRSLICWGDTTSNPERRPLILHLQRRWRYNNRGCSRRLPPRRSTTWLWSERKVSQKCYY